MKSMIDIPAMHHMLTPLLLTLCLSGAANAQTPTKGDAIAGAKIFQKCHACHALNHPTNKIGPQLMNILGRKAGVAAGFQYSEAMIQAADNGLIWDENNLRLFLTSPKTMIPGTSMRFWGLWESQIDDLLTYLHEKSGN